MNTPDLSTVRWRKSSRSHDTGGDCVELASLDLLVAVRDSKDPDGPRLVFAAADWRAFSGMIKTGKLDPA